ncbi:MAG: rhamnogalacturonan lyase B N-terminal domain-containing protein [Massilia sp.]
MNNNKTLIAIAAGLVAASLLAACGAGSPSDASSATKPTLLATTGTETFALTSDTNFYTIDTGAGLVFKVRRTDNGVSTQSAGDISSMVFNGVEYQDQSRGTQLNSGADFLYTGVSAVGVAATTVGTDYIKVTVTAGNLTHYYMAHRGDAKIYMGTYFTSEPDTLNLARFIVRVPVGVLPNGPGPSDIRANTGAVESSDVFGYANGQTRSKHYSNQRLKDWSYIGATGTNVGMWMVRDNNEGNSGGPFFRSLMNQCTDTNQEITYIMNYGESQTEAFRFGVLNAYTLVFKGDTAAPAAVDTSFFSTMGLLGYVAPTGRGRVAGVGINNRDTNFAYTVGFSNPNAQYWTAADPTTGSYNMTGMRPGTYTMSIYKNELAVDTRTVTVTAGGTLALNTITLAGDPTKANQLWRIGNWDGSPQEFVNGSQLTTMHPSDVRMSSWNTPTYVVGTSNAATGWPAYQWKSVNDNRVITFNLTAAQAATNYTLRVGITTAFSGARPKPTITNASTTWTPANPSSSTQPSTRNMTVGTYRGNNFTWTWDIPAGTLVAGQNTVTLAAISGSTGTTYLSPGISYDAVDMIPTP